MQIMQDAEVLNITDDLQSVAFNVTQQPRAVANGIHLPARPPLHFAVHGRTPRKDSNMGKESLAENLERTNQLMKQAEINHATLTDQKAMPRSNPTYVAFTPSVSKQAPVQELIRWRGSFVPSTIKPNSSKTSTEVLPPHLRVPFMNMALSNKPELSDMSIDALPPHKRASIMPKGLSNGVHETAEKPTTVMPMGAQLPVAATPAQVTPAHDQAASADKATTVTSVHAKVSAAKKPTLTTSVQTPTTVVPATKKAAILPHLRVPPHLRVLQASKSAENKLLLAETNEAPATTAKADTASEKENVKIGASPVKSDASTKQWLDTLEAKALLSPKASSNYFADKLIDDLDDNTTSAAKDVRVPTPPGFTPLTTDAPAIKAKKKYAVPKDKKITNTAFMAKALSTLPSFTERYRNTSELGSPIEEINVDPVSYHPLPCYHGNKG